MDRLATSRPEASRWVEGNVCLHNCIEKPDDRHSVDDPTKQFGRVWADLRAAAALPGFLAHPKPFGGSRTKRGAMSVAHNRSIRDTRWWST